jgi:hypothetical protein
MLQADFAWLGKESRMQAVFKRVASYVGDVLHLRVGNADSGIL